MEDDDEGECPLWWQTQVPYAQFIARIEAAKEQATKEEHVRCANWELQQAKWEEFGRNFPNRNWAIWRRYKAGGATLKKVGNEFGLTPERVRQIVMKYDRKLRSVLNPGINKQWDNVSDEAREATLGVEFVFRNELTFRFFDGDQRGWDQLEPSVHMASAYGNAMTGWEPEWGQQDTSPTKPKPAYTYYKTTIEKEQPND
jgi:hypothetical protein